MTSSGFQVQLPLVNGASLLVLDLLLYQHKWALTSLLSILCRECWCFTLYAKTKYFNSKVCFFRKKNVCWTVIAEFSGGFLTVRLNLFSHATFCAGAHAKAGKHNSCLRVAGQLLCQISVGDLSTNPVTLNCLASLSLSFASNFGKGVTPVLVNIYSSSFLLILLLPWNLIRK